MAVSHGVAVQARKTGLGLTLPSQRGDRGLAVPSVNVDAVPSSSEKEEQEQFPNSVHSQAIGLLGD